MTSRSPRTALLALLAVCAATVVARAEIAPQFRRQAQDHAPEAVMIRVLKLNDSCAGSACSFKVRAEVLCTLRSKSGLKAGDKIEIAYSSDSMMLASQPPRLEKGSVYPAFLREDDGWQTWLTGRSYVPSAYSSSFSPLADTPQEKRQAYICAP